MKLILIKCYKMWLVVLIVGMVLDGITQALPTASMDSLNQTEGSLYNASFSNGTEEISEVMTTATTRGAPLFFIITPAPPPCCTHGLEAGRRGYICIAYPNFVQIRYHLIHPFKMKFDPYRRKHVQLDLARNIEQCARNPAKKRIYEKCCDRAQRKLIEEQDRKQRVVLDCLKKRGKNCYQHYG